MKKILVVLTGGTIGSRVEGERIDVTDASPFYLLELYRKIYGSGDEFEVMQPLNILSENMNLQFFSQIARFMWEIPYEKYEGVILTHGSDTLSYTSALLGMLLCHVPVPVVLTASNYPLGEKGSNGLNNFRSAVELINTQLFKGVFSVYQNQNGENNVYLATRLTEADAYLDQFGGFGGIALGKMEDGVFQYNDSPVNPTLAQIREMRAPITDSCPVFEKPILMLRAYPGLDYRMIDLRTEPAAVLHCLYHSATACTEGEDSSILGFMERCRAKGIPFYASSAKRTEGSKYVTAKAIRDNEAVLMENISPEAAYAKLLLLHNLKSGEEPCRHLGETIYFENLPFPGELAENTKK
ncbi:MAG: hypothetical protein HDQ97_07715 [Lachnospiraceae bacterium]|nr:hypothetical protein [Lachnospiraceae bacterium]